MAGEQLPPAAPAALEPLIGALRARFPEAQFAYRESPDRLRAYLDVATDCGDDFTVLETVADRTVDLLLQHGIMVHVFAFRRLPEPPQPGAGGLEPGAGGGVSSS